jgi:methionyl-tRNA formyltransferase
VPSLRALHRARHQLSLVVTQPDRPAGRGMKLMSPSVKVVARELGLPVYQPERIRDPEAVERLRALAPDFLVVVAYGQIIPGSVLSIPRLGAINVHASLLPRWRGAAPVARAILAGDHETGVSIMKMDEQLDHGPVLAVRATRIGEHENAAELTARLAEIGAELLVETLQNFDELRVVAQDHAQATTAPKLNKEEGLLEWSMGAEEIDRRVRGLQPWPGATLPTSRGRVKVLRGHVDGDRYVPDVVQLPGKKPAPAKQVLGDA